MPGFRRVLLAVAEQWQKLPERIAISADKIVQALRANAASTSSCTDPLDASISSHAVAELKTQFDPTWGGFGDPPKFPDTGAIALLLRRHLHTGDRRLLEMATVTLDRMASGGIHDQIGGGFHRYSVDAQWMTPHFEKMLYDNALLAKVYLEAWQATGKELYCRVAADVFDYVLREMTDPRGGFHTSQDADSEQNEGKFYVWRPDEIRTILGPREGDFFCEYFSVSAQGNFEGSNILHAPRDWEDFAHRCGLSPQQLHERLAPLCGRLLAERNRRVPPGKDDKVLAAWNGMMISALARGYQVFGEKRYLEAATRAADFVLGAMVRDGVLLRTYRDTGDGNGISKLPGYLDDYAEMAGALLDLYEAGFDHQRLEAAEQLVGTMLSDSWDDRHGGFYYTSAAHGNLLVRTKPFYDGPVPSGNATAALVLLRLSKFLDNQNYFNKAETLLTSTAQAMRDQPRAHLSLLCAADFYLHPTREIAIVGRREDDGARELLETIHRRFLPNKILALAEPDADGRTVEPSSAPLSGKRMLSGKTTVYVCENYRCSQPVINAANLEKMLEDTQEPN